MNEAGGGNWGGGRRHFTKEKEKTEKMGANCKGKS